MKYGVACLFFAVIVGLAYAEKCHQGDTKKEDCNTCTCFNGNWACTRKFCLRKREAGECHDGETKTLDCNTCRCIRGNWACTRKFCLKKRQAGECHDGETKALDCNTCRCIRGNWACTRKFCLNKREAITARFNSQLTRPKRDVPLFADLETTPCAPNDYFQIDCNTCYCKIDRTGYLCTDNMCYDSDFDLSTTSHIPITNDSMLIISNQGVRLVENLNTNDNSISRIAKSLKSEDQSKKRH